MLQFPKIIPVFAAVFQMTDSFRDCPLPTLIYHCLGKGRIEGERGDQGEKEEKTADTKRERQRERERLREERQS